MKELAILIPCYNEGQTIGKVVGDCKNMICRENFDATIYVYDNNSTDDTATIAQSSGAEVRKEPMQGKGNVIRRMFRDIVAECYVMIDDDDTYDVNAIPKMVDDVLHHQADMVVGDRLSSTYFTENKRPFHNSGNVVVRSAINHLFSSNIRDVMTGMRAFSYQFVKSYPVLSSGFEIETEMTIHAIDNRLHVTNRVVDYRDRPQGSVSKLNTVRDGIRVLLTIGKLFRVYLPLQFFSILAAFLFLIGFGIAFPAVIIPYIKTGLVLRFPTLIVCSFCCLAAVLSFYAGLILDAIRHKERCEFEHELQRISFEKNEIRQAETV